jgi:FMN phosphatase YigB (HAD superfamily)
MSPTTERKPRCVIGVGGVRRTDVAGARAFGMKSIRLRQLYDDDPSAYAAADHVVDSHADLRALLGEIGLLR